MEKHQKIVIKDHSILELIFFLQKKVKVKNQRQKTNKLFNVKIKQKTKFNVILDLIGNGEGKKVKEGGKDGRREGRKKGRKERRKEGRILLCRVSG
jgi:hypothetical protein